LLADEDLNEEQRESVNTIRESGQLDTEIIDCSLGKLLNSVGSLMRPKATEKEIEFEIVENNGLPAQIRCDPTRLRQCLINLIGNAVKFTEKGHVYVNIDTGINVDVLR
jgi:signal transduction histidine kinase